ncbi:glycoside hydrolase family 15 protein [Micromonospora sp. 067-2]|uniref:glycoside hydrolase family 15 protein n=1 Tax=Micromonospora sp. 067-2 TaxID=2789270 RepID=UPI00397BF270
MQTYPSVDDHGLIGDLQTAALISRDGTLNWFCAPRFDSPSIFGGLLDGQQGGFFRIFPPDVKYVSKQLYLPDTPILITRFLCPDGVGEVIDFMPVVGSEPTDRHRIVRLVRIVRGSLRLRLECRPRFDYGRQSHTVDLTPDGCTFRSRDLTVNVDVIRSGHRLLKMRDLHRDERDVWGEGVFHEGDVGGAIIDVAASGLDRQPRVVEADEANNLFEQTRDYWRDWLGRSTYTGRWREMVRRSAMTLKLMTYAPTGGLVAAPTTGLPEQIGGTRNWDYRFTWIRDASLSVRALLDIGLTEEARGYLDWLKARFRDIGASGGPLQIMYLVDGGRDITESTLEHLEGYRRSSPVRIGNAAAGQLQLDTYGEGLNCLYVADTHGLHISHEGWRDVVRTLDWLCDNWNQPEDGIWETRGSRQDFTYGRLLSWVAFDRGLRLAARLGRPADTTRWAAARDAVYQQIFDRCFHPGRRAFVQHPASDVLDASLLTMPALGFIAPDDPMWQSTLAAVDQELVSDSLVYRYNPNASPDGLPGAEGTFTMCSFWYVQALAESGRLDDARLIFDKMLTYSNHLGLYAEEIDSTGGQVGNFPQAFSHLSLITSATTLDRLLDQRLAR